MDLFYYGALFGIFLALIWNAFWDWRAKLNANEELKKLDEAKKKRASEWPEKRGYG